MNFDILINEYYANIKKNNKNIFSQIYSDFFKSSKIPKIMKIFFGILCFSTLALIIIGIIWFILKTNPLITSRRTLVTLVVS